MTIKIRRLSVWICAAALAACDSRDNLQTWIAQTEQAALSRPQTEMPVLPAAAVYTEAAPAAHAFDRSRLPEAFADGMPPEASAAHGWKYVGSIRSGRHFTALIEHRGRVYRVQTGGTVGSARLLSAKLEAVILQHKGRRIVLPLARAKGLPSAMPSAPAGTADITSRSAHTE